MSPTLVRLGLLVASLGLLVGAVLSLDHLLALPVPCGGSSGCETVALHPLARPFGVPIAYVGLLGYLAIFATLYGIASGKPGVRMFRILASLGVIASTGLVVLTLSVIRATCAWCLASAAIMAALGALAWLAQGAVAPLPERKGWLLAPIASIACAWGIVAWSAPAPPPYDEEVLRSIPLAQLAPAASPSKGNPDAGTVIVEFADFSCLTCRVMHARLTAETERTRQVRWVYRHLPLNRLPGHETSARAAVLAAMCQENGTFWKFADRVFRAGRPFEPDELDGVAQELCPGSDLESRLQDGADPAYTTVNSDMATAKSLGLTQTPTYILIGPDGRRQCLDAHRLIRALRGIR